MILFHNKEFMAELEISFNDEDLNKDSKIISIAIPEIESYDDFENLENILNEIKGMLHITGSFFEEYGKIYLKINIFLDNDDEPNFLTDFHLYGDNYNQLVPFHKREEDFKKMINIKCLNCGFVYECETK